ncbi:MAG: hypothetical protein LUF04_14255 [Bacteroides sp.]|nr:hypothetical protein [Bacteroides sp.]
MGQSFSSSRFLRIRIGIWLLPVPFICLYVYLTRHDYIDGGRMAAALFNIFWSLAYMVFLAGESIWRSISKRKNAWLGISAIGIITGIWIAVFTVLNLIWEYF